MHAKVAPRVQRDWEQVFASFAQSGLSVKDFCLGEGSAPSLFYQRRKQSNWTQIERKLNACDAYLFPASMD